MWGYSAGNGLSEVRRRFGQKEGVGKGNIVVDTFCIGLYIIKVCS